jgi:hypothetical protein
VRDSGVVVIYYDCQLISDCAIVPRDDEVAKSFGYEQRVSTIEFIGPGKPGIRWEPEPPSILSTLKIQLSSILDRSVRAGPWVHYSIQPRFMRSGRGLLDLASGTGTRINKLLVLQSIQNIVVTLQPLGLQKVTFAGSVAVPVKTQPIEIRQDHLLRA